MESGKHKILPFDKVSPELSGLYAKRLSTSKAVYISLVILLLIGIAVLPLIKVQIHTQSHGYIRTQLQNNHIHTSIPGLIEGIWLSENQAVQKGDLLLKLNANKLDQKVKFNTTQIQQHHAWIEDLTHLLEAVPSTSTIIIQTSRYQLEYIQFQQGLREYQVKIEQAQRQLDRSTQLHQVGVIADTQLENDTYQLDLHQHSQTTFIEQQRTQWAIQSQAFKEQLAEYEASNLQLSIERQQYEVRAPIAGTITQLSGIQPGNFINPGQEIAQISANDSLMVECYLSPADIGLLSVGMSVKFQIDAFNYNQWGFAEGKVSLISKDVNLIDGIPHFLVRCTLDQSALHLKNGYEGTLKKGMSLTARFEITQRTLFQLLYDKIDNWLNPSIHQK